MLTVKECGQRLRVSTSLVYALCLTGVLPHVRHGRPGKRGTIRIEEAALEAYRRRCEAAERPSASPPLTHIRLG